MMLDHHKYLEFIRRKVKPPKAEHRLWHAPACPLIKVMRTDWAEPPEKYPDLPTMKALDMWGQLGHCGELICWASGGLFEGKVLDKANKDQTLDGPVGFTVEVWEKQDIEGRHYKHVYDVTYSGVKWDHVQHAGNDGASDCWGITHCTYEERVTKERNDEECVIPDSELYPSLSINKLVEEHRCDIPCLLTQNV